MIIDKNEQIKTEIDLAAAKRSESDQRNYELAKLIHHASAIVNFQNCESFTAPPFDRCRTDRDKRRLFASMMAMGAACHLDKLSAPAVAENYGYIDKLYRQMHEYDSSYLHDDPYLKTVSLPLGERGGFLFGIEDAKKGQLFHYAPPSEDGYGDIPRLGYFNEDVRYPIVSKNGRLLAAFNPGYFEEMKKNASVSSEHVLCLGLKMGYFPLLVSRKESVKTVTIVESDPDLVSLFENDILPQFEHAEKIIVLNDDPVHFLNQSWEREYRHVFVCCGYDAVSMTGTYIKIKQTEKKHKKAKFTYWNEESILADIKSSLLILIVAEEEENPNDLMKTLVNDEQSEMALEEVRTVVDQVHLRSAKDVRSLFINKSLAKRIAALSS